MEKLLNITWKKFIKKTEIQAGFWAGRSTIDHAFVIKQLTEKTSNNRQKVHFTFVDMEKAYDTVHLLNLWEALEDMEINKIVIKAIKTCKKMLDLKSK